MDKQNNDDVSMVKSMEDVFDDEFQVRQIINFGTTTEETLNHMRVDWERRRRMCVVLVVCYIVHTLHLLQMLSKNIHRPISEGSSRRNRMRQELMQQLQENDKCRDVIRMGPIAFLQLCQKLRGTGLVKDFVRATVEEQVAKFLHILAHNVRNRTVSFFFHHSGGTITRHFHNVLRALFHLNMNF